MVSGGEVLPRSSLLVFLLDGGSGVDRLPGLDISGNSNRGFCKAQTVVVHLMHIRDSCVLEMHLEELLPTRCCRRLDAFSPANQSSNHPEALLVGTARCCFVRSGICH